LKYDKETVLKGFNQWAAFIAYFHWLTDEKYKVA
jgi:hypothetical protein